MTDLNPQVPWTAEQWARANQAVQEEGARARVAASFLPMVGPLGGEEDFVRANILTEQAVVDETFDPPAKSKITIDDVTTIPLVTLQARVQIRGAQMQDPEMKSALEVFRRAAALLARAEDAIVFRGQEGPNRGPEDTGAIIPIFPDAVVAKGGRRSRGLFVNPGLQAKIRQIEDKLIAEVAALDADRSNASKRATVERRQREMVRLLDEAAQRSPGLTVPNSDPPDESRLVNAISQAISQLESQSYFGPFAVILDQAFFLEAQTPNKPSLVLPQDRILPFLAGGPLLRSSTLDGPDAKNGLVAKNALVIALGSRPAELVIAKDMSINFLQVTADPSYVFRIYEKIALRITQPAGIVSLALGPLP